MSINLLNPHPLFQYPIKMKITSLCFSTAILFLLALGSCQKPDQKSREITIEPTLLITEENLGKFSYEFLDEHNAQNSLDFMGAYKGVLPCADCEGIETHLELESGNSYTKKTIYLDKSDQKTLESSGIFSWNEAGNTIALGGEDLPNQYFVGENYLIHLDINGSKIAGNLAGKYLLTKEQFQK